MREQSSLSFLSNDNVQISYLMICAIFRAIYRSRFSTTKLLKCVFEGEVPLKRMIRCTK